MTKKGKAICPLQGLHDLLPCYFSAFISYCSFLCSLLSMNIGHIAVPQTPKALPQGLYTYYSFRLSHSSVSYLYGLLSQFLQIFAQVSLAQWVFPWSPCWKCNHFPPLFASAEHWLQSDSLYILLICLINILSPLPKYKLLNVGQDSRYLINIWFMS